MADDEEGEETTSRGNEWEVVSLTASTYAAAPGPEKVELKDFEKGNDIGDSEEEPSRAMFMSGHFVFPPSQHENIQSELDDSDIHNTACDESVVEKEAPGLDVAGEISGIKNEENWHVKGIAVPDDFPGVRFIEEKDNSLSVRNTEFEEVTSLQGINLVDEQSIFSATKFRPFHNEAANSEWTTSDEKSTAPEQTDPSQKSLNLSSDISKPQKSTKDDNYNGSGLPCEAWWKRQAASLYAQAKEANAFWSVFVAAALTGLVILGQRWQQGSWQFQQLKWHFNVNDEKMNRMLCPISRIKDMIVGGHSRGSAIRGRASAER